MQSLTMNRSDVFWEQNRMIETCPRCKGASQLKFRVGDINHRITKNKFNYYICRQCDLLYLWPIPVDLSEYYSKQYYAIPNSIDQLETRAEEERYKIDIVRRFASSGRLLEIGSAFGSFLLLAKKAGFLVEAIEMDARCCTFLKDIVGIKAYNCHDPSIALKDAGNYNVITLWHVIEHMPDPWTTLDMIAKSLLPGGILVIATPNPNAFQFKILRRYWPHVDAPRHLELIPLPLLEAQLKPIGLERMWVTSTDKGALIWNAFGWEMFFGNITNLRFVKRRLRKIGRLISRLLSPLDRLPNRGSAYTAVFRKR